jgi:hypothetical protein
VYTLLWGKVCMCDISGVSWYRMISSEEVKCMMRFRNWLGWGAEEAAPVFHHFWCSDPWAPTTHPRTLDIRWWISGNSYPGELVCMVLASRESRLGSPLFLNWETFLPLLLNSWGSDEICQKFSDLNFWTHCGVEECNDMIRGKPAE